MKLPFLHPHLLDCEVINSDDVSDTVCACVHAANDYMIQLFNACIFSTEQVAQAVVAADVFHFHIRNLDLLKSLPICY